MPSRKRVSSSADAGGRASSKRGKQCPSSTESNNAAPPVPSLPDECFEAIAALLDHDTLFRCAEVCRSWRDLILRPGDGSRPSAFGSAVWRCHLARVLHANADLLAELDKMEARSPGRGHPAPLSGEDATCAIERRKELATLLDARAAIHPRSPRGLHHDDPRESAPSSSGSSFTPARLMALYKQLYKDACYDCFELPDPGSDQPPRTTAGPLRLRLCRGCSAGYADVANPRKRLVTRTDASRVFCTQPQDVASLPYALEPNPIDQRFAPMKLMRRTEVLDAALKRWGSRDALEAEMQRRKLR